MLLSVAVCLVALGRLFVVVAAAVCCYLLFSLIVVVFAVCCLLNDFVVRLFVAVLI